MLKKLIDILGTKGDLIDLSKEGALSMLNTSKEMFHLIQVCLEKTPDHEVKSSVAKIDRQINEKQREVRRMVFEHLAISGTADLVKSVQLFTMVSDIERIGDYAKNLADVLDYLPEDLDIGQYQGRFNEIVKDTNSMFDKTISSLGNFSETEANEVAVMYRKVSDQCESIIADIIKSKGDTVKKSHARLLLLVRYIKRINGHLKNVAAAINDPAHCIGFHE